MAVGALHSSLINVVQFIVQYFNQSRIQKPKSNPPTLMKQNQTLGSKYTGLPVAVIIGLLLLTAVPVSKAANKTWNGAGDGTTMNSGANWVGGVAPAAGDSLFFDGTTGLSVNNNYSGVVGNAFAGVTFNAGAGAFTMLGNAIYLSGGITNNSTSLQYFTNTVELNSASRYFNAAAGPIKCDSVNGRNNSYVLIKDGPSTLTLSSAIDNNGLIAAVTNGTLILAKLGLSSAVHALGGSAQINIYTNGTLCIAPSTNIDQIYKNDRINMNGGTFQLQNTNEAVGSIFGGTVSSNSIVENGLANTTNLLQMGENNNRKAIYNGVIRDGAAGVLSLEVYKQSMEQFGGTLTYSGNTTVDNNGTGYSRIIINGSHIGGNNYSIWGPNSAQLAALNGSGLISAKVVNIYSNAVLAAGGALSSDADGATYSDTVATLTISNAAVNLNSTNSLLDVQLNGATAGSGYDQIAIVGSTGSFSNNNANLKLTFGYTPAVGDKFTIVKVAGTNSASDVGIFGYLNGIPTDLSQGAIFVDPGSGKYLKISYRAEGSTFDMGSTNGNDIMLQVQSTPGAQIVWRGDVNNAWDVLTTANWRSNGVPSVPIVFGGTDNVTFDDSGSNSVPIDLTAALTPANITVNATNDYVFATSTAGKLTGTVVMTKTNSGTLSIVTDNDNSGTTIIQGGTVQVGTNGTTGTISGSVIVNSGGTIAFNRSDDKVINTATISGTGAFIHRGDGKLTISADLSSGFTGSTTNTGGLLQLGDGTGSVGQIGGTVYVPASTNVVSYNFLLNANINNALGGGGTVNYISQNAGTLTLSTTSISSNFTGVANLVAGVRVHAQNGSSFPFGNTSIVNVPAYSQAWCDTATYNNTFNIAGTGWINGSVTPTGAISVFGSIFTGAINLAADARISGTITGGTIFCPIAGGYQLEIWGNSGSYVLSIGPTNGVHSYASTLITSGTVQALNTNAISTGPLTMDVAGDLRLNGNNLTVANLSSVNNHSFTNVGPTIQNIGTNAATLTVGADATSTEFDGVFFNGGAASLGLNKVGAGTLTLTGVNTNTGTVSVSAGTLALSGSGSFNNAAVIAVGSGATYDVTAAGGTLTLNSGQTLQGSGTVNGSVSTSVGSVVNPGDGIGALTITGNATLAGGLTMELNRTNAAATNDSLIVTGTFTPSSTLLVKNLGSALHVGDTFQLFAGAVSGFSAINLPATDANGYGYTWQNNIGVDGSIQVLTAAPAIANYYFRSVTSGNWSDLSTWQQSTNGVNWVTAVGTPDYTATNILIQTGTTVTNSLAVMVDRVTIQTNATVLLTTGNLIITNSTAAIDCLVAGSLTIGTGGGIINNAALATLVFTNGGNYVWNSAVIPAIPSATWRDGSTCRISAMATGLVSGISGQSFYDFIWDTTAAGQSARGRLNITGTSTIVRRDFTVTIPDTAGASMTINNDTNGILTVGRNVVLTGGNVAGSGVKILLNNSGGQTNLFKVGGNFTVAGYVDGFGSSLTTFEFNGSGSQSLTLPSSTFLITASAMNWLVDSSSTVALASSVPAFNSFTNNGTLTFGANKITGGGTLVLNTGSKVNGNGTNNLVSGITSLVNGGTLNLTNSTSLPTFAGGEIFSLFSAGSYSGTFGTLLPTAPDVTHTWVTTQLNTAGILAVGGGVNTNAPQVQVSISGNTLSLAWPTNKGWTLLTNSAGLTATSQWFPYPNSANLTNVNIPVDPTKTNVFFRMAYPYP